MTVISRIWEQLERRPEKVAWRYLSGAGAREITCDALASAASKTARAFQELGLANGDVALIFLPHGEHLLPSFLGAMLVGAIPSLMPCPSRKQHADIYWSDHRELLARIKPRLIVTDSLHRQEMSRCGLAQWRSVTIAVENLAATGDVSSPRSPRDDAPAFLQHSSGTTSLKKGVVLSNRAVCRQIDAYAKAIGATPEHNIATWLPVYHDMGLIACTILPLMLGQTVTAIDPFEWTLRPELILRALADYDGHFCWMPNFGFEHLSRCVAEDFHADLSDVIAFVNCSEPCKAASFERFLSRFSRLGVRREQLSTCYAMAETVFAVTQTSIGQVVHHAEADVDASPDLRSASPEVISCGKPLDALEIGISDGQTFVADGVPGEIVIRGECVFDGYLGQPEMTAGRFRNGWYCTRDMGFIRSGHLHVLGRKDDLIIVNGRNVYAHEIEAIANSVPGLKPGRNVAFGAPNELTGGDQIVIVAERLPAADVADMRTELVTAVFEHTSFEVGTCSIVDPGWLVKTTSGKISRSRNRAKFMDERGTS